MTLADDLIARVQHEEAVDLRDGDLIRRVTIRPEFTCKFGCVHGSVR